MKTIRRTIGGCMAILLTGLALQAQSNQTDLRTAVELEKGIGKKWDLSLSQEWRLTQGTDPNEFLLEGAVSYEPIKYLGLGARYRLSYYKEPEASHDLSHQMAFDIKGKFKYRQFRFQLRTRLTNYNDFEMGEYLVNPYLRYRAKMEFTLNGVSLLPMFGMEIFHQLDDREINKLRYSLGLEYRFNKSNRLEFKYHLQDYLKKDYKKNIISLQYKFLF